MERDDVSLILESARYWLAMALGEKIFEERGKVTSASVKSVHPVEGVKMEVDFVSEIKGLGNFPSGTNMGSGTMNQYPHGTIDAAYHGVFTSAGEEKGQFFWWAHDKSRMLESGRARGVTIVSGFTSSQKLSWLNSLIIVSTCQ